MRLIQAVMIVVLIVGSFAATFHAMAAVDASKAQVSGDVCSGGECPDDQRHEKTPCLDCVHCCTVSVLFTPYRADWTPIMSSASYHDRLLSVPMQSALFSLLRPPKNFA